MVEPLSLFADLLWILGLAGLLATLSAAEAQRSGGAILQRTAAPERRSLLPAALSLFLVGIGLSFSAWQSAAPAARWAAAAAGVLSALSIILVILALRRPQRAGAELATPGRPTT